MDLKKELKANDIIKTLLYKYLNKKGYFNDWRDDYLFEEDDEEDNLPYIRVVGYEYDEEENTITVYVAYNDEVCESGYGFEEYSVNFNDFQSFEKGYEEKVDRILQ